MDKGKGGSSSSKGDRVTVNVNEIDIVSGIAVTKGDQVMIHETSSM